ncbi:unnamed protein product [Durusdinium trenchii]|uniref:Uncharacterized protein n=2 Tax=Durusdinium trenchii TaxID=1381693 RepID=A0ABP0KIJ1_9DINO
MTVAAIPAPVTTRSQRRKWSERLFVAVLFIGLAARGGFSYPRGLNSTASNAATPGKASPMAFAHVAAPVEKEDGGYGRIATLVAIPALFVVMCRQTSKVLRRAEAPKHGHGNPDILPPVMTGLFLWVILMSGIQQGIVPVPGLEGKQNEFLPIVLTFIAGYGIIVLEEVTEIHKTATALILGVMIWAFIGTGVTMPSEEFETAVSDTLKDISEVVFFLLGALTVVELMDAHKGFDIITASIKATKKKELMVIIGVLTFLLSSVLNNLTVVIVMVSLLQKLVKEDDFRRKLGGLVVVASNAGGAWTPMGDITTTMLYIGGQVTTVPLLGNLLFPSIMCLVGTLGWELIQMKDGPFERPAASGAKEEAPVGQAFVFWGGLAGMIFVPVFSALTQCPAWSGMMLNLGMLALITSLLHEPNDDRFSLKGALSRIEVADALFFLGVLFAVGGLERVGILKALAEKLSEICPIDSLVAILLGFASAVVDNVPLVAASQGMYDLTQHPPDDALWNLITYCAATGGSLLVIGSAAGVAFMGMEKNVTFGWYVKAIGPAALMGYFFGVAGIMGQQAAGLAITSS